VYVHQSIVVMVLVEGLWKPKIYDSEGGQMEAPVLGGMRHSDHPSLNPFHGGVSFVF
jgi:hypothetical protein